MVTAVLSALPWGMRFQAVAIDRNGALRVPLLVSLPVGPTKISVPPGAVDGAVVVVVDAAVVVVVGAVVVVVGGAVVVVEAGGFVVVVVGGVEARGVNAALAADAAPRVPLPVTARKRTRYETPLRSPVTVSGLAVRAGLAAVHRDHEPPLREKDRS